MTGPNGAKTQIHGLIDTGADLTALPFPYAPFFGYDTSTLEVQTGTQAQGTFQHWKAKVPLRANVSGLPAHEFELWPSFLQSLSVLRGRMDFLRAWSFGLAEADETFTIMQR